MAPFDSARATSYQQNLPIVSRPYTAIIMDHFRDI